MSTTFQTDAAVTCHWLAKASGATVRVYLYLRTAQLAAARHRRLWIAPRLKTIADDLAISIRTAGRAVKRLAACGLIAVQHRFARLKTGLVRQISNRIRVAMSTEGALALKQAVASRADRIAARAQALAKNRTYSLDNPVTAGMENKNNNSWRSSPLYRQLVFDGLHNRR